MAPLPPFGPWKRKCYQMTDQVLGLGGWAKYKRYLEDYICGNISKLEYDEWLNENIGHKYMYIHNAYIVEILQDIKDGKGHNAEQEINNNNTESSSSSSSSSNSSSSNSSNDIDNNYTRKEYTKVVDFLRSSDSAELRTVASILDMADVPGQEEEGGEEEGEKDDKEEKEGGIQRKRTRR